MAQFKLPTYDESSGAMDRGEASALQMFIAENEPANGTDEWRERLADVIDEALFSKKRAEYEANNPWYELPPDTVNGI